MQPIITERLILRPWQDEDVARFARINQDPQVLEFLPKPLSYEETSAWVERIAQHFAEHGFGLLAASLKTGEFIGYIGLNIPTFKAKFTPCVEIGWRLAFEFWRQGFATEGAKAVLDVAFNEIGLKEVVAFTVPANTRSIRVIEKIGMTRDFSADFRHPNLPKDHPLSLHLLYRAAPNSHRRPAT
jgi:RimJ/RimL family protein N-acetyltransferase